MPEVALPDLTGMAALPPECWRVLAARLRQIGVTRASVGNASHVRTRLPDPLQLPLRRWHLRRLPGPATCAMRLLMFADSVAVAEAREALGGDLLDDLVACGYIRPAADGGLVSPFLLNIVNNLFVICDDLRLGGEAVMGGGPTTAILCQAAHPARRLRNVLDLGCGAGTAALLYAPYVDRSIGVDVNPRAVALSRINAALNGIANVEFRQGDLFAPVAGETFDLIISQPPYVAQPPRSDGVTFLYGGPRGDELPRRVLRELPASLAPGGRAVLLVEWPEFPGEPLVARIRAAVGDNVNVLLLQSPGTDLDEHCIIYGFSTTPEIDPNFGDATVARREHFASLGVERLLFTIIVLEHSLGAPGWTELVEVAAGSVAAITSGQLDRLVAAATLQRRDDAALLDATLRVPPGTKFAREESTEPSAPPITRVVFPAQALRSSLELNSGAYLLVSLVQEAPTVRAAAEQFAARYNAPLEEAIAKLLPGVRQALATGVLEPA